MDRLKGSCYLERLSDFEPESLVWKTRMFTFDTITALIRGPLRHTSGLDALFTRKRRKPGMCLNPTLNGMFWTKNNLVYQSYATFRYFISVRKVIILAPR